MALDGLYLRALANEIKNTLISSRIDKITQPEKDEIILSFKINRKPVRLLLNANASYPRINFIDYSKESPLKAPVFCMVLRKYLNTAVLEEVTQLNNDRILLLDFESSDDLGFNSIYTLIIEIMGRHSNITLIRKRDGLIMDSIKHITPDINSYRVLYPGIEYVYPPESNRLDIFNTTFEAFQEKTLNLYEDEELNEKFFTRVLDGLSNPIAKEISFSLNKRNIPLSKNNLKEIYEFLVEFFAKCKNNDYDLYSYSINDELKDFHCINLEHILDAGAQCEEYSSPSSLLESFYHSKDKINRLQSKSHDMQKLVTNNIDRIQKKLHILKQTLVECEEKPKYNLSGELITANIYNIKKGDKEVEVLNYYSEEEEYIKIPLDVNKTPAENAQKYFKKYNKLKAAEENAYIQIELAEEEDEYLQSVLSNIENADNYKDLEDIKNELVETGYIAFKKSMKSKKTKPSKPLHFISSDSIDIYVGKNNLENDYLTLKFAHNNDIWLHIKNIPGSHVIIKNLGEVPDSTLLEAATLAAFYSKGKNSTKVPIDYTEIRNVKKMAKGKPGMVTYSTNKTIYVDPIKLDLKQV
ncbi:NFACT RNA binding domain-containing protein [Clostridium sp.]|uniref:Rqc2 family fibronectin-binding protein n=1 Tax=Clostridium sp. TaxID=1506 RepID=UPI00321774CD